MNVVLPAPRNPETTSISKGVWTLRELRLQPQSLAAGSGSTSSQCSSTASAISTDRKQNPARSNRVACGAIAACTSLTRITVEIVIENGNSRFIGFLVRNERRNCRCSGRNSSLRFRTPRNTFSFALWCIHHSTMNVHTAT